MQKTVLDVIRGMIPHSCQSEADFQVELVNALHAALPPTARVMSEFKASQSRRIDIGIHYEHKGVAGPGWWILGGVVGGIIKSMIPEKHKFYIEIKKDLREQNELHRLIGQISINKQERYLPLIVILFGNTDPQVEESLEQFLQAHEDITLINLPYTTSQVQRPSLPQPSQMNGHGATTATP